MKQGTESVCTWWQTDRYCCRILIISNVRWGFKRLSHTGIQRATCQLVTPYMTQYGSYSGNQCNCLLVEIQWIWASRDFRHRGCRLGASERKMCWPFQNGGKHRKPAYATLRGRVPLVIGMTLSLSLGLSPYSTGVGKLQPNKYLFRTSVVR